MNGPSIPIWIGFEHDAPVGPLAAFLFAAEVAAAGEHERDRCARASDRDRHCLLDHEASLDVFRLVKSGRLLNRRGAPSRQVSDPTPFRARIRTKVDSRPCATGSIAPALLPPPRAGRHRRRRPALRRRRGCEMFAQRVLLSAPAARASGSTARSDEMLYVLEGDGRRRSSAGCALHAAAGTRARPSRPARRGRSRRTGRSSCSRCSSTIPTRRRGPLRRRRPGRARSGRARPRARQFALGVRAEAGCPSVTQFIGFVPPGRAPDHFHRYDEVIYVLEGEGILHIDGEEAPLAPGACVHLPSRLVHCLENSGPRGAAAARRVPALRLARPRPTTPTAPPPSTPERTDTDAEDRTHRRRSVWEGNVARGRALISAGLVGRLHRAAVLAARRGSGSPRARRAPRSCSRPPTAAASRCRSPPS